MTASRLGAPPLRVKRNRLVHAGGVVRRRRPVKKNRGAEAQTNNATELEAIEQMIVAAAAMASRFIVIVGSQLWLLVRPRREQRRALLWERRGWCMPLSVCRDLSRSTTTCETNKQTAQRARKRTHTRQTDPDKRGQTETTTHQEKRTKVRESRVSERATNARHISAAPNRPQIPPVDIRLDRRVDHRRIRHHARQDDVLHVVGDL